MIWTDDDTFQRLEGVKIDIDTEKESGGFLLDHADAAFAAFR